VPPSRQRARGSPLLALHAWGLGPLENWAAVGPQRRRRRGSEERGRVKAAVSRARLTVLQDGLGWLQRLHPLALDLAPTTRLSGCPLEHLRYPSKVLGQKCTLVLSETPLTPLPGILTWKRSN